MDTSLVRFDRRDANLRRLTDRAYTKGVPEPPAVFEESLPGGDPEFYDSEQPLFEGEAESTGTDPQTMAEYIDALFSDDAGDATKVNADSPRGDTPEPAATAAPVPDNTDPLADSGIWASDMDKNVKKPTALFYALYPGSVVYLTGPTGKGKTSMIYNIVLHLSQNLALWGVTCKAGRPLRIWYLDAETSGELSSSKIGDIGVGYPATLRMDHSAWDLSSEKDQERFLSGIKHHNFDLVVIDPISMLFGTGDENSNSEAVREMRFVRRVARETNACIVLVHHPNKSDNGQSGYGRGASARLSNCDVGLIWHSNGDSDTDDTYHDDAENPVGRNDECRLQVVKNKLGGKSSLYLRMAGKDRFDVSSFAAWQGVVAPETRETVLERAIKIVTDLWDGTHSVWLTRKWIIEQLKAKDIGATNVDAALKHLSAEECGILKCRRGAMNATEYALAKLVDDDPVIDVDFRVAAESS